MLLRSQFAVFKKNHGPLVFRRVGTLAEIINAKEKQNSREYYSIVWHKRIWFWSDFSVEKTIHLVQILTILVWQRVSFPLWLDIGYFVLFCRSIICIFVAFSFPTNDSRFWLGPF